MAALSLLLFSITSFFGSFNRYFELSCHFRLQYLFLGVLLAFVFIVLRSWKYLSIALLILFLNAFVIAPYYLSTAETNEDVLDQKIRIVSSNLFFRNKDYNRIIDFIGNSNADIVLLQEATMLSMKEFRILRSQYPHVRYQANRNNHGLALLSHHPISKFQSSNFTVPYLRAEIKVNGQRVTVLNTHLFTPTSSWRFENRNIDLREFGSLARTSKGPLIVAGDFNMSIWSPYYSEFIRDTELKDARNGFGLVPTWPTHMPLVMIPIDHFLVSSDVKVLNLNTGSSIGSDHLPLVLDVAFAQRKKGGENRRPKSSVELKSTELHRLDQPS
jgi:endonuclease/exonuclease/phosphatase (EEP) superfamily protein YafD